MELRVNEELPLLQSTELSHLGLRKSSDTVPAAWEAGRQGRAEGQTEGRREGGAEGIVNGG